MKDLTVKQFLEIVEGYQEDIGDYKGNIASHSMKSKIVFYVEGDDEPYYLDFMEPIRLLGCACWAGIEMNIKRGE